MEAHSRAPRGEGRGNQRVQSHVPRDQDEEGDGEDLRYHPNPEHLQRDHGALAPAPLLVSLLLLLLLLVLLLLLLLLLLLHGLLHCGEL